MTRVSARLLHERISAVEILRGPDHMAMIRCVTGWLPSPLRLCLTLLECAACHYICSAATLRQLYPIA